MISTVSRNQVCVGCGRSSANEIPASKNQSSSSFLCEACKKFHLRYRQKIDDEVCVCNKNDEKCRRCRFDRCQSVISGKRIVIPLTKQENEAQSREDKDRIDFSKVPCAVCGYSSSGYHFGAVSCEGCKGFFRRSMHKNYKLQYTCKGIAKQSDPLAPENCLCPSSSNCRKCRLQRCVDAGMSLTEGVPGRHTAKRKIAIAQHLMAKSHLPTKMCRRPRVHNDAGESESTGSPPDTEEDNSPKSEPIRSVKEEANASITNDSTASVSSSTKFNVGLTAFDSMWRESSEALMHGVIEAAESLRPISAVRVCLQAHWTDDQIKTERCKGMDIYLKCVTAFVTRIPGNSEIGLSDRIALVMFSFVPLMHAQLGTDFDVATQTANYGSLDRASLEICLSRFSYDAASLNFSKEVGNLMASTIQSKEDFALLCALLYLNPNVPNLSQKPIIQGLRIRYERAALLHFSSSSCAEEMMGKFYHLLGVLRRATSIVQNILASVYNDDFQSWTPLISQLLSGLFAALPRNQGPQAN